MDRFWEFRAAADENVTDLYLTEEISRHESWWFETSSRDAFRAELNRAKGDIRVWIDSPGGDSFAGAAMYDMLREYSASGKGRVVAMVSLAASAASLVAMAADEIRISVVGTIMVHRPWVTMSGRAEELRATADTLDEIRDAYVNAYVRRTGLSEEKVMELLEGSDGNGTYMNAMTAIELGFADGLMYAEGEDDAQRGAATADLMARMRVAACISREEGERGPARMKDHRAETEELRRALMRSCLETMTTNED